MTSKVHCLQRKWLFCWTLIPSSLYPITKRSVFGYSGCAVKGKKTNKKTDWAIKSAWLRYMLSISLKRQRENRGETPLEYSWQPIKNLLADGLLRRTSVWHTWHLNCVEFVYGKIPVFSVSVLCWWRARTDDLTNVRLAILKKYVHPGAIVLLKYRYRLFWGIRTERRREIVAHKTLTRDHEDDDFFVYMRDLHCQASKALR